jgi:hypothetical protein
LGGGNASHFEGRIEDMQPMVGVRISTTYLSVKMEKPFKKTKR